MQNQQDKNILCNQCGKEQSTILLLNQNEQFKGVCQNCFKNQKNFDGKYCQKQDLEYLQCILVQYDKNKNIIKEKFQVFSHNTLVFFEELQEKTKLFQQDMQKKSLLQFQIDMQNLDNNQNLLKKVITSSQDIKSQQFKESLLQLININNITSDEFQQSSEVDLKILANKLNQETQVLNDLYSEVFAYISNTIQQVINSYQELMDSKLLQFFKEYKDYRLRQIDGFTFGCISNDKLRNLTSYLNLTRIPNNIQELQDKFINFFNLDKKEINSLDIYNQENQKFQLIQNEQDLIQQYNQQFNEPLHNLRYFDLKFIKKKPILPFQVKVIGISGPTRSGKGNLANYLALSLNGITISQDKYSDKQLVVKNDYNWDSPQVVNWKKLTEDFNQTIQLAASEGIPVVIIEGFLLFYCQGILEKLNDQIYLQIPEEEVYRRRQNTRRTMEIYFFKYLLVNMKNYENYCSRIPTIKYFDANQEKSIIFQKVYQYIKSNQQL